MKKLFILLVCLVTTNLLYAQGVNFQHLTYAEALEKAKMENKLVFMDCYTSWCGPCKYMAKEVFTLKEAGDYFNSRFINIKFDMEEGEGKELAHKFKVRAYPTFFILRADGSMQHKIVGGAELNAFIEKVERGLHQETTLPYLTERYCSGKMKRKEMPVFYQVLLDANEDRKASEIYKEFVPTLSVKDKLKADYWVFLENTTKWGDKDFDLILENISRLEKNIGKEKLSDFLYQAYRSVFVHYLYTTERSMDTARLVAIKSQLEYLNFNHKDELLLMHDLSHVLIDKNTGTFLSLLEQKIKRAKIEDAIIVLSVTGALNSEFSCEERKCIKALVQKLYPKATMEERQSIDYYISKLAK